MAAIREGDLFGLIEGGAGGDSDAFSQLLGILDSDVKLRGILYRSGLRPEDVYPDLASKLWESLKKWDGRDFRAFAAQIARNFSADERRRKKSRTVALPEEQADEAPLPGRSGGGRHDEELAVQEAVALTYHLIGELETTGEIKPLDVLLFQLLQRGLGPSEIQEALSESPLLPRLAEAMKALCGKGRLRAEDALAIRGLIDGLAPAEAVVLADHPDGVAAVEKAAKALGDASDLVEAGSVDREAGSVLCRRGTKASELESAVAMSTNAINLRMNRVRLKLWMAFVDRAFRSLDQPILEGGADRFIVQHRCRAGLWCRMYKDRTCSMERTPAEIADLAKAQAELDVSELERLVDELRERILLPLEGVVPDYNSCLGERRRPTDATGKKS